jgi:uncharacterized protein YfiM (DUF2279 family)
VIADQQAQVKIRDQELGQAQILLQAQAKEVTDLKASNDSWLKSPTLWLIVGAVAGAYIARH